MNYTQNKKIEQVTADTLIIGIDIGSDLNYARAFDWRGMEVAKRVFKFKNTLSGFNSFGEWTNEILEKTGMTQLMIGMDRQAITGCRSASICRFTISIWCSLIHTMFIR